MAERRGGMAWFFGLAAAWVALAGCGGSGAGDGEGGSGAAGGGGSPPVPAMRECVLGEVTNSSPAEPAIVSAVTGKNGTFTDHCDGSGNLVEYVCEVGESCAQDFCEPILTGKVVEAAVDCDGTCEAGSCDLGCPGEGSELSVTAVDAAGITTLNDAASGTEYTCAVAFTFNVDPNGAFECTGAEAAGAKGTVAGVSTGGFCTRGEGSFSVVFSAGSCSYHDCARSK